MIVVVATSHLTSQVTPTHICMYVPTMRKNLLVYLCIPKYIFKHIYVINSICYIQIVETPSVFTSPYRNETTNQQKHVVAALVTLFYTNNMCILFLLLCGFRIISDFPKFSVLFLVFYYFVASVILTVNIAFI